MLIRLALAQWGEVDSYLRLLKDIDQRKEIYYFTL